MSDLPPQTPVEDAHRPKRSSLPSVVFFLLMLILAAHVARLLASDGVQRELLLHFAVVPSFYTTGETPYQTAFDRVPALLGHMFLHPGIVVLAFNSYALLEFGGSAARVLGGKNFLAVFFLSGVGGGLTYVLVNPLSDIPLLGASSGICGLFGAACGTILLRTREIDSIEPAIRVTIFRGVFWFLLMNVGLVAAFRVSGLFPVAWEPNLGGFVVGALLAPMFEVFRRRANSPLEDIADDDLFDAEED